MIKNPFALIAERIKKSGDTMSGQLSIDQRNGTISDVGYSVLALGNSIASGTANNSTGIVDLYSDSGNKVRLYTVENVSGTKYVKLPNASGTVALDSLTDLTITINTNTLHNYSKINGVRFGNIAIITGFLETKGAVSQNDVLFTFSGITPSKLMYATALKSKGNNGIVVRIEPNTNQAVVDDTPTNATANYDFYCFNMVIFGS